MTPPSLYRCETCDYEPKVSYKEDPEKCPYKGEENYYKLKEEVRIPEGVFLFTSMCGCASHSSIKEILEE